MALQKAGVTTIPGTTKPIDPGSLNEYMINNELFTDENDVLFDETAWSIPGRALKLNRTSQFSLTSNEALDEMLCKGFPVIVHVPDHFVLVTEKNGDTFDIIDPGHRGNTTLAQTLAQYGSTWQIRGYIADPLGDISGLDIHVGRNAELLVTDGAGKRTGLDSITGAELQEIPQSVHFVDGLANDETGAPPSGHSHSVLIFQPSPGIFHLSLVGLASGQYILLVNARSQDGGIQPPIRIQGMINTGEVQIFMANVSTTNGGQTTVTQILPPVCNAGGPYTTECNGALTSVKLNGSGSTDPNGSLFTYFWSSDCPAATFDNPASSTPTLSLNSSSGPESCNVTLTVSNTFGLTSSCSTTVTVKDTTSPQIGTVTATPSSLWPPNHKLVPIHVGVSATDNCSPVSCKIISVASNEPTSGLGDGDQSPDWQITGALDVQLRAERSGNGNGRTYTITVQCSDSSGNTATKAVQVRVPHDQGKN
jgi:hypothetical protein